MLQYLVDQFAKVLSKRPGIMLVVVALTLAVSLNALTGLRFSTDMFAMAPPDAHVIQTFRKISSAFGNSLFVVVHSEEEDVEALSKQAEQVAAGLEASELFHSVRWQLDASEISTVREFLRGNVFNYRSVEEEKRLGQLLDPDAVSKRLRQVKALLLTPFTPQAAVLNAADPLAQIKEINLQSAGSLQLKPGPLLSPDKKAVLLITSPKDYPQNINFSESIVSVINELNSKSQESTGSSIAVNGFGAHITTLQYGGQLKNDVAPAAISSVIGCSLFFFLLYRSWSIVIFTAVSLASGVLISLGIISQFIGMISPFTVGISALLVGTGIDHAIHFFNRYIEEREAGKTEPVRDALSGVGVAVLMAALTTGGAFLFMLVSRFSGIRDYGFAGAAGVFVLLFTVLAVVPSLIQLRVRVRNKHSGRSLRIKFPRITSQRAKRGSLLSLVLTLLMVPWVLGTEFDMDINSFRTADPAYIAQRDALMSKFGLSGKTPVSWVIEGQDLDATLDLNDRITVLVKGEKGEGKSLSNVDSLSTLLPGPTRQKQRLDSVDTVALQKSLERLNADCSDLGLTDSVCDPTRKLLEGAVSSKLVTKAAIETGGLSDLIAPYLTRLDNGKYLVTGRLWATDPDLDGAIPESLALRIEALGKGITVAGPVRGNNELRAFFHDDLARVCALAAGGIFLMMLFQYRKRPLDIILTLAPVAVGLMIFIGLATILGFEFGVLSLVIFPLVIGVGIDSSIHLTHHLHVDRAYSISEILNSTGRALIASAVTTAIGCSANLLTSNPQVQDMGLLCAIGVLTCMSSALLVWPSLAGILYAERL